MTDMNLFFTIFIPICVGIAFLARKRYHKFDTIKRPIFFILAISATFMASWDFSIYALNFKLVQNGYLEIPITISDNLSFGVILYFVIPINTFLYVNLVDYFFKPTSVLK